MNEENLFHLASQQPAAARDAFLDEACAGDAELRRRIEILLRAHDHPGSFLAPPTQSDFATEPALVEGPGTTIGPYKLLEQIGEGGFGIVFMAEQQQPVRRKVALKVLKPGMDTKQVVARFEAERQALALMDHPNIAQVFDGGETMSGRPYFVMELVRGIPITDFCDQNQLPVCARLELFGHVCQAVQHAHQKGIIHRDLKPSNMLVTLHDDKPVVKVIDFGIVKATGQQLTEKTLFTGFKEMIGTPLYMSPEQAQMSGLDIDTRSDIYSLGVLLYELLTGTTPLEPKRVKEAAILEVLRLIREEEPPRPSARLSTTHDRPAVAAQRGLEPKKLSGLVRGELDWIVMKCLEKDRNRRYETASGLALDLQRYLDDEPVLACPPSVGYRLGKFARRHKAALTMAGMVVGVLVLAVAVLAVAYFEVNDALVEKSQALARETAALADKNQALGEKENALTDLGKEQQKTLQALGNEISAKNKLQQALSWNALSLADREWQLNNVAKAEEILDSCPKEWRFWEWHYLKRLCHKEWKVFAVKKESRDLTFSPDGKWLAVAGKELIVLDAASGAVKMTFPIDGPVNIHSISFSPDGRRLAALIQVKQCVAVFDRESRKQVLNLPGKFDSLATVRFSPDGNHLACGAADGTIRIWEVMNGQEVQKLQGHKGHAIAIAYNGDGKLLASVDCFNKTVKVWDVLQGVPRMSRQLSTKNIYKMNFSQDGKYVALLEHNGIIRVLDANDGNDHAIMGDNYEDAPVQSHLYQGLSFSPDGTMIAATGRDPRVVGIWTAGGTKLYTFRGHTAKVVNLAFTPDGKRLASLGIDNTVRLWDVTSAQEAFMLKGTALGGFAHFVQSGDGSRMALVRSSQVAGKKIQEVLVFDPHSGILETTIRRPAFGIPTALALSRNGQLLAVGYQKLTEHTVKLFAVNTGQEVPSSVPEKLLVEKLRLSPDGHKLITFHSNFGLKVWEIKTGKVLLSRPKVVKQNIVMMPTDAQFGHDGRVLAVCNYDGTVTLWNLDNNRPLHTLQAHQKGSHAAFRLDDKQLVTAGADGNVKIWDVGSGQCLTSLVGHAAGITCVAWSPDGQRIVTGAYDKTMKLWDPENAREVLVLRGLIGHPSSVAYLPDSHLLVACHGGTISFYDGTPSGQPPAPLPKVP